MSTQQSNQNKLFGTIAPTDVPTEKIPVVELTKEEIRRVDEIASRRCESYNAIDGGVIFGERSSLTNHQVGFIGEAAVAKFYNLPVDADIYPQDGDGGVDLQLHGNDIDVKTTQTDAIKLPELLVRADKKLSAELYVRAHVLSWDANGAKVRILGAADRKLVKNRDPRKHPGDIRNYVVYPNELTLLPALNK